jgi:hypothetical protein
MDTTEPVGQRPLITFFLQPYPNTAADYIPDDPGEYCEERCLNLSPDGIPLHLARFKTPPTSVTTPGHTIPAGYTPGGKYKPSTHVNSKTDKRAGK